jgi:hypothetical protein
LLDMQGMAELRAAGEGRLAEPRVADGLRGRPDLAAQGDRVM